MSQLNKNQESADNPNRRHSLYLVNIIFMCCLTIVSLVFALVTVQIARRTDGLFEDQIAYLIRTQAERRKADLPDGGDTEYGNI